MTQTITGVRESHLSKKVIREQLRAKARLVNAYLTLLLAQVCMSSGGIFGRFALNEFAPLQTAALRLGLASVPLLIRFLWVRGPRPQLHLEAKLVAAGLALALVFGAWTSCLMRLPVGTSTLLTCTAPFWNGLYESLVLRRRSPPAFWVALAIAMAGVGMMVMDSEGRVPIPGQTGLGVCLALTSSLSMAIYFIIVRHVGRDASYTTFDIISRTYGCAAIVLTVVCLCVEHTALPPLGHWKPWMGLLGLATITQSFGHTLQNMTLKTIRPSIVGFAALSEPLIASALAIFLFDEKVTWKMAAGGCTLLCALAWSMRISMETDAQLAAAAAVKSKAV